MITIIQASPSHVLTIREIAEKTWWPAYREILSEGQIRYMLSTLYSKETILEQLEEGVVYLLLLEDQMPVGFAAYAPREENPDIFKLHKIYCLPETQGKGYGKMLIEEVSKRVLKAGKNILELNVNRYNKAKTFYEKMGFSVIYEEDIPVGEYWMNDFVMRKQLRP